MPLIHLVRHAEPAGSWGSHPDPGLSELGRAQARAVVRTLAGLSPRATVSSPLLRCQETAAPFAVVAGLAPRIEPRVAQILLTLASYGRIDRLSNTSYAARRAA